MSDEQIDRSNLPRKRGAVLVAGLLATLFVAGLFLPAILQAQGVNGGTVVRMFYHPLCHQIPERSLSALGSPMAVCARCAGLYVGGALGLLLAAVWVVGRRDGFPRILFFAAITPTLIDALLPWVGLTGLSNVPRFWLAVPTGLVAALFLAIGIADCFTRRSRGNNAGRLAAQNTLEVVDG